MAEQTLDNQTAETAAETETGEGTSSTTEEKTLTQAEVDRIVKDRLTRERQKYADYDDLKAKAEAADSSKSDLEKLTEQIEALKAENETNKVKALRSEVASAKGVPAHLLTAKTQEDMEAQADALLEFAKSREPKTEAAARPKESLRSGASNNERETSPAEIAKSILQQRRGY